MNETLDPRRSLAPAAITFALGLVSHGVDQLLYVRAGPVPILVAGPVVASLVAIYARGVAPPVLTLFSLVWGVLASGAAVLLVYLAARSERRLAAVTLLVIPVVQGAYGLVLGILVILGIYA